MLPSNILRRFPHLRLKARLPTQAFAHRNLATAAPSANDLFANGTNTYYVEEMYRLWKLDKSTVHVSWDVYFSGLDKGLPSSEAFQPAPTAIPPPADGAPALYAGAPGAELDDHLKVSRPALFVCLFADHLQVQLLVRAYQVRGHHIAELDPLGILDADLADVHPPELELSRYGFTERDLEKQISLGPGILPNFATEDKKTMSLGEIIKLCKRIYCQCIYLIILPCP
jgi:2-oxoglutarate dehydrogenase E1 component